MRDVEPVKTIMDWIDPEPRPVVMGMMCLEPPGPPPDVNIFEPPVVTKSE